MATDSSFLDQLADVEVPATPVNFERRLHWRLNDWLLVVQIGDLIAGAFPYALKHFVRGLGGLIVLTLTGQFPAAQNEDD